MIGLRIDVDTFRGTRHGVPNLCQLLASHSIFGTFFLSVGPDNMGRHLWRLFKPSFLVKMLRSKAPGLYGWDILLRGTLGPGPVIGEHLSGIIRTTAGLGHEIGMHAWDHHAWQAHIDTMGSDTIRSSLEQGVSMLSRITGSPPVCSAVPGWKCSDLVLAEKEKFQFKYNSDCRGKSIFLPIVNDKPLAQPQVPSTLPTYDEVIGRNGISDANYNEHIMSLVAPGKLNVLTIHAEVEGISKLHLFSEFINRIHQKGWNLAPLGSLLKDSKHFQECPMVKEQVPGREGWVSVQGGINSVDRPI